MHQKYSILYGTFKIQILTLYVTDFITLIVNNK